MSGVSLNRTLFFVLSMTFIIFFGVINCAAEQNIDKPPSSFQTGSKNTAQLRPATLSPQDVNSEQKNNSKNANHSDIPVQANNETQTESLPGKHIGGPGPPKLNTGAMLRGFYVFIGLSAVVLIYIAVRAVLLRRRKTTVRKYGILANREDVEMTPLGADDDEEDTTLFDVSSQTRP